jgi:hypothetical protein
MAKLFSHADIDVLATFPTTMLHEVGKQLPWIFASAQLT